MSAAEPKYVASLANLAQQPDSSGVPTEALVHRTEDTQVVVQLVPAGGELEAHHHTGLWDYFVGLGGQATITLSCAGRHLSTIDIGPGGFLAVPPHTTHHIVNHDPHAPFVFLLTQSPYSAYDFVTE